MKRIFIAIELPPKIKNNLVKIQGIFKNLKAKWPKPEHMHLTLIFLGEIEKARIFEIQKICQNTGQGFQPFEITFLKLGAFPNIKRAHTLWVGIKDSDELTQLQKKLALGLKKAGFRIEERPFSPHLTLARFKKRENLKSQIADFENRKFGQMRVLGFNIFESELFPEGPKHKIIRSLKLKAQIIKI